MSYIDLRPHNTRPTRVFVDGAWSFGHLAAYRREPDGTWHGCVQWSATPARSRVGWFGDADVVVLPHGYSVGHLRLD